MSDKAEESTLNENDHILITLLKPPTPSWTFTGGRVIESVPVASRENRSHLTTNITLIDEEPEHQQKQDV